MPQKQLTAKCEFEIAAADDLFDAIESIAGRYGQGVVVAPPGAGPDNPLSWSIQEVNRAGVETDMLEREKLCTNAVLNARRALACLVDWYVSRDLAELCKNPPGSPKQKAEFLVRRGVIDELTSHVLTRAIDKRNRVEHDYIVPELEVAEDVVELLRRTMTAIRLHSDPSYGPWIFGIFLGGHGLGKNGRYATFGGWCEPLVVFSRFDPRPWAGVVLPDSETNALIRYTSLADVTLEQLLHLLSLAEQKFGRVSSFSDIQSCQTMARELGFTLP